MSSQAMKEFRAWRDTPESKQVSRTAFTTLNAICKLANDKLNPMIFSQGHEELMRERGINSTRAVRKHIRELVEAGLLEPLTRPQTGRTVRYLIKLPIKTIGTNIPVEKLPPEERIVQTIGTNSADHRNEGSTYKETKKTKSTEHSSEWNQISASAGVTSDFQESNLGKPLRTLRELFSLEDLCFWAKGLNPSGKFELLKGFTNLANSRELQEKLKSDLTRDKARRETPLCDLSNGCNGNGWIGEIRSCKFRHNDDTQRAYERKCESEAVPRYLSKVIQEVAETPL